VFIIAVLVAQVFEGTDPLFAFLCSIFFALFVFFFNLCEGFLYPSGAWLTFFALGSATIGVVWKIIIVEPGQSHLLQPNKTMFIYCVGMVTAGAGLTLAHNLRIKRPLLQNFSVDLPGMWAAAIGCFVLGTVLLFGFVGGGEGGLGSIIRQLNQFPRMALILATTYEVRRSGGKHSVNWVVLGSGGLMFFTGLITFSKEGMFVPFVGWLLPAVAAGVIVTRKMIATGLIIGFVLVYYMVPYSQYGRGSRQDDATLSEQIAAAEIYLFDLEGTRQAYNDLGATSDIDAFNHFYDTPQGLADREQMLSPDDALINVTDQNGPYGLYPTAVMYLNAIPHFIWPNKPFLNISNVYSHELGELADNDDTTAISFSPVADAYHQATWGGVLLLVPIVLFLYGFINDSVVGTLTKSPWALLPIAMAVNVAPQGLLSGTAYLTTYAVLAVVFIASVCRFLLAPFGSIIAGKKGSEPEQPASPPRPLGGLTGPQTVEPVA
jgi:hypothetical protein